MTSQFSLDDYLTTHLASPATVAPPTRVVEVQEEPEAAKPSPKKRTASTASSAIPASSSQASAKKTTPLDNAIALIAEEITDRNLAWAMLSTLVAMRLLNLGWNLLFPELMAIAHVAVILGLAALVTIAVQVKNGKMLTLLLKVAIGAIAYMVIGSFF